MSARPGIAALIAAGESNQAIARVTDRSVRRVQAVRKQLRDRERHGVPRALAMQEIPAGSALRRREWTPDEQARHRADLLAALRDAA